MLLDLVVGFNMVMPKKVQVKNKSLISMAQNQKEGKDHFNGFGEKGIQK